MVKAAVVFVGASVASLVLLAQVTPGWRAPVEEVPLTPEPAPAPQIGTRTWTQESATVRLADGGQSEAWVLRPTPTGSSVPGVVMIAGAGEHGRDAMLAQARSLASGGVASITYAKRAGASSAVTRDFEQLAADAVAASEVLAAVPGVDPHRIGLLGFSEGAWVSPLAIDQRPDRFGFLVLVSAPVVTPLEQVSWMADRHLSRAPDWVRRVPATVLASGRSVLGYLDFDVRPALTGVDVPVLAIWGTDDPMVPVTTAVRRVQDAVRPGVTVRLVAGAGHRPPPADWAPGAAEWIRDPSSRAGSVSGGQPVTTPGIAEGPRTSWINHPLWSFLGSVALAIAVYRRRRISRSDQLASDSCGIRIQPAR